MVCWVVGVAVVPGGGDDMHAGRLGHRSQAGRIASETDGSHLDDRAQPAARRVGHLLDRAIDVIEVLARKRRAAKEQVVVRVGYSELVRPDRTQNCHDLTHTRPVHQRHYKRHVSTPRS